MTRSLERTAMNLLRPHSSGVALIVGLALILLWNIPPGSAKPLVPDTPVEYLNALQIADSFLSAWLERDQDSGISLMSARLRNRTPPEKEEHEHVLRDFVSGISAPHHQAFEISSGRKIHADRYSFPVTLYEYADGDKGGFSYRSALELVRENEGWRVDKLPKSSNGP